jgi:hypothetical protein
MWMGVFVADRRRTPPIAIGFASKETSTSRAPGWEPDSWGYHGDDGHSFASQNTGKPYADIFGVGDTVGCLVNFRLNHALFTKNGRELRMLDPKRSPVTSLVGVLLVCQPYPAFVSSFAYYVSLAGIKYATNQRPAAIAFKDTPFKDVKGKLYPIVGLKKKEDHIMANFGQRPFMFDIDGYMKVRSHLTLGRFASKVLFSSVSGKAGSGDHTCSLQVQVNFHVKSCECRKDPVALQCSCTSTRIHPLNFPTSSILHCMPAPTSTLTSFTSSPSLNNHGAVIATLSQKVAAARCALDANPSFPRTEAAGNDRGGDPPRRHLQARARVVGDRPHPAAGKC